MRTRNPISTISFNTKEYLILKLNEFVKAKKLSFWVAIKHKPEDDEGGAKEHFHVFAIPSKQLQTDDLRDDLKEFDPFFPGKPRGCLMFFSSKYNDWCLYALHDKSYLASKNQSRRFHYSYDDFFSSNDDDNLLLYRGIDRMSLSPYSAMLDAQKVGLSFAEFFRRGTIPIQQVNLYQSAWNILLQSDTNRGNSQGHANAFFIDDTTGELINTDDIGV